MHAIVLRLVLLLLNLYGAHSYYIGRGPNCVRCNQARGEDESVCNYQSIEGGNSVQCGEREVCTTDVRCDGQGRVLWIKGCEKISGITAFNKKLCNEDYTRCRYHCDTGDYCNEVAPAAMVPALKCTPDFNLAKNATCLVKTNLDGTAAQIVEGTVTFYQVDPTSDVTVTINLSGFSTTDYITLHGFHVHEFGDVSTGCAAAGGHYNPNNVDHGARENDVNNRHVGDLGNIEEDKNGAVMTEFTDSIITLFHAQSIVGRAIVVHAGEDDLGTGGDAGSLQTGNAGGRLSCCTITLQ